MNHLELAAPVARRLELLVGGEADGTLGRRLEHIDGVAAPQRVPLALADHVAEDLGRTQVLFVRVAAVHLEDGAQAVDWRCPGNNRKQNVSKQILLELDCVKGGIKPVLIRSYISGHSRLVLAILRSDSPATIQFGV